jgi:hypothetical protein
VARLFSLLVCFAVVVGSAASASCDLPEPGWQASGDSSEPTWPRAARADARASRTLPTAPSLPVAILPAAPVGLAPPDHCLLLDDPRVAVSVESSWTPSRCPRGPPPSPLA